MKTKREVLKTIAEKGFCCNVVCDECPYYNNKCTNKASLKYNLTRIGAKAILRMFPEKREFNIDKILTCITADQAKVGMRGYFGDSLVDLRTKFENRELTLELVEILDEKCMCRFRHSYDFIYSLFYPIEEVEE